jgi:hypothetical protein
MAMELIATKSVLSIASKYRADYLRNFYELGRQSIAEPVKPNEPLAYLIPAGQARDEAVAKLIESLIDQGMEVFRLDSELHVTYGPQILQRTNSVSEKLGAYRVIIASTASMQEVPAGSYIAFLSQPQHSNVVSLFEPQIYPNRLTPTGEAERPYDVAGWTLPLQMGVDAPAVTAIKEPVSGRKLTQITDANVVRKDLALSISNAEESPIENPVKRPVRVGIYRGWMANMDEGWTRFIFDSFNVPYSSVTDAQIRRGQLGAYYDVLILPSQKASEIIEGNAAGTYPPEYTGGITTAGVTNLKEYVAGGGTLICFDAACELPIKQFRLPVRNALELLKSSEFYCPGSIVGLDVDNTQKIAAGLRRTEAAYFINSSAFESDDPSVHVVARYARDNVLRSGWLLGEDKIRSRIALAEVPLEKGRVVLFAFRPQHRGQAWGTLPFLWNAISTSVR